jgi:hypothetical protein
VWEWAVHEPWQPLVPCHASGVCYTWDIERWLERDHSQLLRYPVAVVVMKGSCDVLPQAAAAVGIQVSSSRNRHSVIQGLTVVSVRTKQDNHEQRKTIADKASKTIANKARQWRAKEGRETKGGSGAKRAPGTKEYWSSTLIDASISRTLIVLIIIEVWLWKWNCELCATQTVCESTWFTGSRPLLMRALFKGRPFSFRVQLQTPSRTTPN